MKSCHIRLLLFVAGVVMTLIIAGCQMPGIQGSNVNGTPIPATIKPATETIRTTPPAGIATGIIQQNEHSTPTAEDQPGVVFFGYVRTADGAGVAGVNVYRSYASYPGNYLGGELIGVTDADGYYQSGFHFIPGDEMILVWAEKPGLVFDPPNYYWRHYAAGADERAENDFVARQP